MEDLQFEELRQIWLQNKSLADETVKKIEQLIEKYEKPSEVQKVEGELKVNTEKQIEVTNLDLLKEYFENISEQISKSIEKNSHKPIDEMKVLNFPEFPKDIDIKNAGSISAPIIEALKQIDIKPKVTVEKQDITLPTDPRKPISVRLSDGKSFYKALNNAIASSSPDRSATFLEKFERTRFNEQITATRTSTFNYKPTWGLSSLRYTTSYTGTGATADEVNGEFKIESGTSLNGSALVRTGQRGQYQAGAMGQAGIGVRIPVSPTSTARVDWGYTDFNNGFMIGVDASGNYVAYVTGGVETKIYQQNWNIDTLDGNGNSRYILDYKKGVVTQIDFTWYGYGDIEFNFYIQDRISKKIEKVTGHRVKIDGSASVVDPNQPLSFRAQNGASNTTNTFIYIGGHQFSVLDGLTQPQSRQGSQLITSYLTAANTDWQPIIAIRKKTNFRGRLNSIATKLEQFELASDGNLETRLTIGGTTSNLTWVTPTARTASETSVEVKVSGATALTTSADGEAYEYGFVVGTNSRSQQARERAEFFLGANQEAILWVRRLTGSGGITVLHAHVDWLEEW